MPTLDFISIDPWRMIIQIGNLIILFLLMKKFLFKPVKAILDKRQAEVDSMYNEAAAAETAAKEMRDDYEQRLASAKQEPGEILRDASQKAQLRSEEMLDETRQQTAAMKAKASAEIEQEKKKAANEIKDEVSSIAMDIASKVVEREISAADHAALVDAFISNMGDAS